MNIQDFSLILLFALALSTGGVIVALSAIIGRRSATDERKLPYECGLDPIGTARNRFSVKFFMVAVLFIIFDVEVVFLYPWALVFKDSRGDGNAVFMLIELAVFLAILGLALLYAWGKGALEWEK